MIAGRPVEDLCPMVNTNDAASYALAQAAGACPDLTRYDRVTACDHFLKVPSDTYRKF